MKKFLKGSAHLLLIVIVLIGIGALVYFSAKNGAIRTNPTPELSPTPTSVLDKNVNWKMYTNEKYKYQFSYPGDWKIISVDGSIDFPPGTPTPLPNKGDNLTLIYIKKNPDLSTSKQMQMYINILENSDNLPLKDYFRKAKWSDIYIDNMEETTINNLSAIKMVLPWTETITYFISFDKFIAHFEFSYFETEDKFPNPPEDTFNRIVSTFKFKDSEYLEGKFCGGFTGVVCPEGYECKLDGNYPDAGGTCAKK